MIDWHYDKTNSDYLKEIKNDNTKQLFKRASYVYDYIWYGDFPVDEQLYQKHEQLYPPSKFEKQWIKLQKLRFTPLVLCCCS